MRMDAKHRDDSGCEIVARVTMRGFQKIGMPRGAAKPGHLPVRLGDALLVFADRDALKSALHALNKAATLADVVAFGPERDAFDEVEEAHRRRFEKGLSNDIDPTSGT